MALGVHACMMMAACFEANSIDEESLDEDVEGEGEKERGYTSGMCNMGRLCEA